VNARASAQASLRFPFLLTVPFSLVVAPAREEAMRSVAGHIDEYESEVESLMLDSMLLPTTLVLLLFITMLLLLSFIVVVVVVAADPTVEVKTFSFSAKTT
jgi:hypothetical protein